MDYQSFTTPGSYEQVQSDIAKEDKRRKLIEAMQAQNLKQGNTSKMVSGRVVPYGVGEGLTKIASALMSRSQLEDTDKRKSELLEQQSGLRAGATQDVMDTILGREGQYEIPEGQQGPQVQSIEADPLQGSIQAMTRPELKDSGMDKVALAMLNRKEPKKPARKYKTIPEMQPSGMWQDRAVTDGIVGDLVGEQYKKGSGASDISVGGDSKYADERMKKQAQMMDDLGAAAKSAYNESLALDRFIEASKTGSEGGAQPIITGVKNFLASAGYSDDSLVSVATMGQALGDMKVNKIAQFGARGLTDKDMEIINLSMPKIETSQEARIAVAEILKKVKDSEVQNYIYALDQEKEKHPDVSAGVLQPRWLGEYRSAQENSFSPANYIEIREVDGQKIGKKEDGTYEVIQ